MLFNIDRRRTTMGMLTSRSRRFTRSLDYNLGQRRMSTSAVRERARVTTIRNPDIRQRKDSEQR